MTEQLQKRLRRQNRLEELNAKYGPVDDTLVSADCLGAGMSTPVEKPTTTVFPSVVGGTPGGEGVVTPQVYPRPQAAQPLTERLEL